MKIKFTFCFLKALFIMGGCLSLSSLCYGNESFPLRAKYPNVKLFSTKQLNAKYDSVLIVDVRSRVEYDIAHVNKSVNIPISNRSFLRKLGSLRAKAEKTPIVFYCNGHACAKSYKATTKAAQSGFAHVFAYDSGIFDWIKARPEKATLMGETPTQKEKLIPKNEFMEKLVHYSEFSRMAEQPDVIVIDIREPFQRKIIPKFENLRNIPLERLIVLLIMKSFTKKKSC